MKYLTVVVVVGIFAGVTCLGPKWETESARSAIQECVAKENITQEDIDAFHSAIQDPTETSRATRCLSKCLLEGWGFMIDGVLDKDALVKQFAEDYGEDNVTKGYEACKEQTGDEDCEKEFKAFMCMNKLKQVMA